jgi:hypothetical protein
LRGRTSALAWTRRLRTLAVVNVLLVIVIWALLAWACSAVVASSLTCVLTFAAVDAALLVTSPAEVATPAASSKPPKRA